MSVTAKLLDDMKLAMKAGEKTKLGAVRLLLSEVKNTEIDQGTLDEAGFQKVVTKLAKQIRESMEEFAKAGREETAAEEKEKLAILEAYLPAQLSDDEIIQVIKRVKAEFPELQGGKLMGAVMSQVAGKADGSRVKSLLSTIDT